VFEQGWPRWPWLGGGSVSEPVAHAVGEAWAPIREGLVGIPWRAEIVGPELCVPLIPPAPPLRRRLSSASPAPWSRNGEEGAWLSSARPKDGAGSASVVT